MKSLDELKELAKAHYNFYKYLALKYALAGEFEKAEDYLRGSESYRKIDWQQFLIQCFPRSPPLPDHDFFREIVK